MRHGSLFSGIGGFDLAAEWMGWTNVFNCEIDPFCRKVLLHHFPNSYQHEDIRTTDFTIWRGKLDLITGGFPCQPYSTAGKRKGKDDDRHLWPQMLRAIREIQPGWIVGENVRGLTNWNGGLVFDEVQADLEAEGYEVLPFLLPACAVNAPHRRDRIWFVAYSTNAGAESMPRRENQVYEFGSVANAAGVRCGGYFYKGEALQRQKQACGEAGASDRKNGIASNTDYFDGRAGTRKEDRGKANYSRSNWLKFPTQSPICNRNDGLPSGLADITFSKWRKESIKALGNAVVPQVVYQIYKAIEQWQLSQE